MLSEKIILANWKMQLSLPKSINLAKKIKEKLKNHKLEKIDVALCPDFLAIPAVSEILKNTNIDLGSQNVFWENWGAYTGEVSIKNLKHFGVKFIMIGHSERRQNLLESDKMINQKIKTVINEELIPVLCIGENLEQKNNNQKDIVIMKQVRSALADINMNDISELIIAYEPIWSISTTKIKQEIETSEIEYTNQLIKQIVIDTLSPQNIISSSEFKNKIKLIFGGSVNSSNIVNLMRQNHVQGVLVGGASLDAEEFTNLINNTL